jgi:hypothetical protein
MNNSYVKIYRKVLDNHFLANDNNAFLMFTKLLLKVDYTTGTITLGRKQLSHLCNMKESTTYATAGRLVDNNLITTQANRKFTKITVVNWSKYQGEKTTAQQPNNETVSEAWLNDNTIKRTKKKNKNILTKVNISNDLVPEHLLEIMQDFEAHRKAIRKPMNPKAKSLIIQKLEKLFPNNHDDQIKSLEQSIMSGWSGVFDLKEYQASSPIKEF